jgi:2-oxoglutarate ferredoxin oxidoreductase subunit alpha
MQRFAIKIVGASGQGINTVGEILAKSLKRSGLCVYAYREYPSLIKGGHASYQIDVASEYISSATKQIDCLVVLNRQKTNWHLDELRPGGIIIHDIGNPRISQDEARKMRELGVRMVFIPALELAKSVGGNALMTNIVSLGYLWRLFARPGEFIEGVVREAFADKPQYVELDVACMKVGLEFAEAKTLDFYKRIIKPDEISEQEKQELHTLLHKDLAGVYKLGESPEFKDQLLITGNEAMAIGAVNAGVRIFYAYPMTPSSSILMYLAEVAKETGMIVKQVEDEITAAAMALGSMHAGARALTATSGGGFDLMTEHISLAAITETPLVVVLAQRPGPATGLPTWTTQGDLLLAAFAAHGEFSRLVVAAREPEDGFYTMQEAFNLAEEFQIPVIVMTDKLLAETNYTAREFDTQRVGISRGKLVLDEAELVKLKSTDRFALTDDGISKRWLPGSKGPDFNANSDEHDFEGNVTEEAQMAHDQIVKRLKKQETLLSKLPDPVIYYNDLDFQNMRKRIRLIGWGSTYGVINDVMKHYAGQGVKVDYMDVKYLWPLKAEAIAAYLREDPETILIEGNHNGQLGQLIRMATGIDIKHKILRWDGRPFFCDELISELDKYALS